MFLPIALLAIPVVSAAVTARDYHEHPSKRSLPGNWYHPRDHPAYDLFKRGPSSDGSSYPEVGTPTWASAYPVSSPDVNQLPQAWVDALDKAVQAGKIPNVPQSAQTKPNTNPLYPPGVNPMDPNVCSATYKCRIPGDIWDAPEGMFGTGFDDGPLPSSAKLLSFLQQNNEVATHFMIGVNILGNPQTFLNIFNAGGDIAVHTYTHPYMTMLDNKSIVAQLGWTMQIIHHSTGGRLPRYWRPPFGDYDQRVRAIAEQVFGLKVILWNQDTEDWSLSSNGTTMDLIHASMAKWISGPKSPGLIVLEHELSDTTIQAFIDAYPLMKQTGWTTRSAARLAGFSAYQNVDGSGSVSPGIVASPMNVTSSGSSSPSSSSKPASSSGSGSGAASTRNAAVTRSPNSASALIAASILITLGFITH